MGEVYRARLVGEGGATKKVALKLVRGELAARGDFVTMFVDEARLAMTLSHANVVHAFDVGRVDERWFIAMEYVDGPTLGQLSRAHKRIRGGPLPPRLAVTALVEALKGLDYAHRRRDDEGNPLGLVHRDISPGNVLVSREGEVKLTDFGIAKSELAAGESMAGTIKGKIAYMAPEQLRGEQVDARADVYAAGVVLFEILGGKRPFDGPDQLALVPDVLAGRRAKLSAIRPDVDPELERIVDRAMSAAPGQRYESAAVMRQDLEAFAMRNGWLLSTTDIADLIQELEEEFGGESPKGAPDTPEARSHTRLTTFADKPPVEDFDLRLGAELRRVSSDEPVSVFVTGASAPEPETPTVTAEAAAPVALDAPDAIVAEQAPRSKRRPALVAAIFVAAAVVAAVVIAATSATDSADAARPVDARVAEQAPVTPVLVQAEAETTKAVDMAPHAEGEGVAEAAPPTQPRTATPASMRRRRAATMSAAANGTLWVASDPWGWVFIDGERVGRTTLRGHPVRAGRHQIVVQNPAAELEARTTVNVGAGEVERVSLTLGGGMR